MFVLQRIRYKGNGSFVKIAPPVIEHGFGPAYDLADATVFPSSAEAIQVLVQRTLAFPDLATDRFQLVEIVENPPVPPTYEIVRVL